MRRYGGLKSILNRRPGLVWVLALLCLAGAGGCSNGGVSGEGPPPVEPDPSSIEWERSYGGSGRDTGAAVALTDDGGYIIAGQTASAGAGDADLYLVRTGSSGARQWEASFGGPERETGLAVLQSADGGFVAAGQTWSTGAGGADVYLVKASSGGTLQWERAFGGSGHEAGLAVIETADGGLAVAGWTESSGPSRRGYLVKTDRNGNMQWEVSCGRGRRTVTQAVLQVDGGYLLTGWTESGSGDRDLYLALVDVAGTVLWEQAFNGGEDEIGFFSRPDGDGGYTAAGLAFSYARGTSSVYLVKVDGSGQKKWEKNVGETKSFLGLSVHPDGDAGFLVLGQMMGYGGYRSIALARLGPAGEAVWEVYFGGGQDDAGLCAIADREGGVVVTGWTETFGAGDKDVYLARINP